MSDYRTCGACYESVHKYASKCPHCHTQLVPEKPAGVLETLLAIPMMLLVLWGVFEMWAYIIKFLTSR